MYKKLCFILSVLIFSATQVAADTLQATVSNTQAVVGEVFDLEISYDGTGGGSAEPDLSALRQDFTIYSTSNSMQTSYINGKMSQQRSWTIGLMPKNEGQVQIPALKVGNLQTNPIKMEILPQGSSVSNAVSAKQVRQADDTAANRYKAEFTPANNNPYVQQQVNAELTIYDNVGLQFTSEPVFTDSEDWIIRQIGNPAVENTNDGGRKITFRYALFAQKSGELIIPSVQADAFYISFDKPRTTQNNRGFFGFFDMDIDSAFGTRKPVKIMTKPQPITVKSIPADYGTERWLPAENLTMAARFVDKNAEFKVGETIAREVIVIAKGMLETQMPELELTAPQNFKQYPERPQYSTEISGNDIVTRAITRIVYIPQKNGQNILPEIKLVWFNLQTGKKETAVIPATSITVSGDSDIEPEKTTVETPLRQEANNTVAKDEAKNAPNIYVLLFVAVFSAFLTGALFSFALFRRTKHKNTEKTVNLTEIQKNLTAHDYRGLRDNLLKWGQHNFPLCQPNNLIDLAQLINREDFRQQMEILNGILYADSHKTLDADIIIFGLKSCKKKLLRKTASEPLPRLYK
jgi:hypothetical protein